MNIDLKDHSIDFLPWRPELGRVFNQPYAFDTETTLIDDDHPWLTPCFVLGAVCDGERGYFIQRQYVAEFLKAHEGVPIVFHNAPFDLDVLQLVVGNQLNLYDWVDQDLIWDTQLLHKLFVLGTEGHVAKGKGESTLETCAETYLNVELPKDTVDSAGDQIRLSYAKWLNKAPEMIEPVYLEYLGKDVLATIQVYHQLQAQLHELLANRHDAFGFISADWLDEQIRRWGPQTHHIQLRGAIVLRAITANGIHVDVSKVDQLKKGLQAALDGLLERLRCFGYIPGTGSDKALQAILKRVERERPELVFERTKTGKISAREEALEQLRGLEPFVDVYLDYKEIKGLLATHLDKLKRGVLHPSFNPLVESGRTSSFGDINAQNLPRNDEVRSCLIASPGHVLIDADYATVELATLAQTVQLLQGRPSQMARRINAGEDLHRVVAAAVTGKCESEVDRDERQKAKAINFGKPGGMGTAGLVRYAKSSYGVEFSKDEARDIEDVWFELFPEMREYLATWIDAGVELALLLDLTADDYAEFSGHYLRNDSDETQSLGILGRMCLRAVAEERPITRTSFRPYTDSELDYFWNKLQERIDYLPESTHADIQARRPSVALAKAIRKYVASGPVFTATGRLRADAGFCQQKNTPFQGLAADGAKLAMWRLWRAGYRIVNFIHDEVVVEVPADSQLGFEAERMSYLMRQAMQEVVPHVIVNVECNIARCWSKNATTQIDEFGRLVAEAAA